MITIMSSMVPKIPSMTTTPTTSTGLGRYYIHFIKWFGSSCVKPRTNLIFLKNDKNNKIAIMVQGSLENSLDLG